MALSQYILKSRSELSVPVAFPGKPRPTDLDVLQLKAQHSDVPLTQQDIDDLRELREDLIRICTRAQERGVKVIIDAEHRYVSLSSK